MNAYNQNFSGTYCVCHRPYPDPEDPIPDEMIQCIICEDWYHSRHLGVEVPEDNFAGKAGIINKQPFFKGFCYYGTEMTCQQCITKHDFLLHYDALTVSNAVQEEMDVSITDENNSDCKKPKDKSDKITAKFWLEVYTIFPLPVSN